MNMLSLSLETTNAISFENDWFVQLHNIAVVTFSNNQPFYNRVLLGYGDMYCRGMESYVIDGTAGFLSNTTLYKKLLTYVFNTPFIKTKTHNKIPFTLYLKAFTDFYGKRFSWVNSFKNRPLFLQQNLYRQTD